MIREDADNFQRQLVHLFRVFEVNVAVGLTRSDNKDDESFGVTLRSQDSQVDAVNLDDVKALAKSANKKKDVLSG